MPKIIITSDMLLNQMKRDSLRIAESFDGLCAGDMAELSDLLADSATIALRGMYDERRADKDLQIWSGELLTNIAFSLSSAVYVLRAGYRLVPGVILRNAVEAMAVCLHGLQKPQDLARIKSGKFDSPKAIITAKKVIPHFGDLYGFLSKEFAHAGPLHHSLQPLTPYTDRSDDLLVHLRAIRASVLFHYIVAEFAFVHLVDEHRYWHIEAPDRLRYSPSEAQMQWQKRFLYGPELP
jgi:hypothetical protein